MRQPPEFVANRRLLQPPEFVADYGLLECPLDIFQFRMCQNNYLVITDLCTKILFKPVVNLALNETVSFEMLTLALPSLLVPTPFTKGRGGDPQLSQKPLPL